MAATHTSGPWVWVEGTGTINRRWNNLDWTVASVGNHRLGWHKDKNSEAAEAGANARLIAAAPELLAALEWLVDLLPDPELDNDELQRVWTKKARAAITKATGGAA